MRQPDKTESKKEPAPKGFKKRVGRPRICSCCGEPILRKDGKPAKRGRIAVVMMIAAREAKRIVDELANGGGITEGTKARLTEKFAVTIFIEGMRRGL